MKFWSFVSFFRSEPDIINTISGDPKWSRYADFLRRFNDLVDEQNRTVLDMEMPDDLCRSALARSCKKFVLHDNHLVRVPSDVTHSAPEGSLSALEVYESYGGECLEEIEEHGSYRVK